MAIQTLSTSLKIDSSAYQLHSSYDIAYNQHIRCINISFYTHALILFNSAPSAAASAAFAATDPLLGQKQTPSLPIVMNDQDEWEVNKIQNSRHFGCGKRLQYQVKWHNWDRDLEWYNADGEEFENCKELTQEYH